MAQSERDSRFVGTVPDLYERLMVPMIFAEAADDLAEQVARRAPDDLLELAAGTGVLTRAVLRRCPTTRIVATDLNEPMLAVAAARLSEVDRARVTWSRADALHLELGDDRFDVVACQFGVMFFPDRLLAFREARRVLRPGGSLVLNVWDSLATNDFARVVHEALLAALPRSDEPLRFMERVPHGVHDADTLLAELGEAGFETCEATWVEGTSRSTAAEAALAYCQGTPMRGLLADHPSLGVAEATRIAEAALAEQLGSGPIEGRIRSLRIMPRSVEKLDNRLLNGRRCRGGRARPGARE